MPERRTTRVGASGDPTIAFLNDLIRSDPQTLESPGDERWQRWLALFGGDTRAALAAIMRLLAIVGRQREELIEALRKVSQQIKPSLAWMLSAPFAYQRNGSAHQVAYCVPLGREPAVPAMFECIEGLTADHRALALHEGGRPALALVDETNRILLGTLDGLPEPPVASSILPVMAACETSAARGVGELEVCETGADDTDIGRRFTVLCRSELARAVSAAMQDGEQVRVRVQGGVATAIYETRDRKREPWLTEIDAEGPLLKDLVFPPWLHEEFQRDLRRILKGKPMRVALIGPTGVGKSEAAARLLREALCRARKDGRACPGAMLIRLSPSTIGSTFQHGTELKLRQAVDQAKALMRRGWMVLALADEADALFGETDSVEHAHQKTERLAFQELVSDELNVPLYLTMNPRRQSWLPAAIANRFRFRRYPRLSLSQAAGVAACYVSDAVLGAMGMRREEFAGVMADYLFCDDRVVATAHLRSGRSIPVRMRDLHCCSPRKVKEILQSLHDDLEDGLPRRLEDLWRMIDREMQADLNVSNFWSMTFLEQDEKDMLVAVKPAGRQ